MVRARDHVLTAPPLDQLGPEADRIEPDELAARFAEQSMRLHGFLRDQHSSPGSAGASPTRSATAPSCRRSR